LSNWRPAGRRRTAKGHISLRAGTILFVTN
jgi:hypothetical protein